MQANMRRQAVLVLFASAIFFTNLGGPRLWDRDEPRNAACASEMLARGDWIVPVMNAELRAHKPVLLYWLIMSAYSMFGVGEFAARFWSALLSVGTVLITYQIGRRLFHSRIGLWAGVILSTTLMFDIAARAATPDAVLIFFSSLAMGIYVISVFKPLDQASTTLQKPMLHRQGEWFPSWPMAALMYAAMGMAVLAKGPVGLVLPTAVIGMFLLLIRLPAVEGADGAQPKNPLGKMKDALLGVLRPFAPVHFLKTCWSMRPITAITVTLAVALPWYWLVGVQTDGEFLRVFFWEHNIGRATSSLEGHNGSFLFYPLTVLVGFFPWSVFVGPVLISSVLRIRRNDPCRIGFLFAACWVGVYIGLFSLAQTKLPSYITPCYPALALLVGCYCYHWVRGTGLLSILWNRLSIGSLAIVGVVMLIALPLVAAKFLPGEEWLGAIGAIPLVAAISCFVFMQRQQHRATGITFTAAAFLFALTMFSFVTMRVDRHQLNHQLLDTIASQSDAPVIGALGNLEPSWIFYADQPVYELKWRGPDQELLPAEPLGNRWRPRPHGDALEFLSQSDHYVITTNRFLKLIEGDLPSDIEVLAEAPYFLKKGHLLLLGRKSSSPRTALRSKSPSTRGLR